MKILALSALSLALAGCANTSILPQGANVKSPAEIAGRVCPPIQATLSSLSYLALPPSVEGELAIASNVVNGVCTVGSAVTTGNLQSLMGNVLPALTAAVKASSLTQTEQNTIILDLTVAQIVLSGALALNPPLTSVGTSVPAVAASAAGK